MRTRERALLMAKELGLDQGVRYRAAVDGDKRLLASGAQLMDRPSDELLASAGLALDEDRERGVGHLLDLLDNLLHRPVRAHQKSQRALDDVVPLRSSRVRSSTMVSSSFRWRSSPSCWPLTRRLSSRASIARRNDATK